jgi:hypothetical protein
MTSVPAKRRAKKTDRGRTARLTAELRQMVLLPGEDAASYEHMLAQVIADVDPQDAVEELFVEDIVQLAWDARFLRRAQREVVRAAARQQLAAVLAPAVGTAAAKALTEAWQRGERSAQADIDAHLAALGTSLQAITAQALTATIDDTRDLDDLICKNEIRRHNALRELARHREALATRVRQAVEKVEDADFAVVDNPRAKPALGDERLKAMPAAGDERFNTHVGP